jgi:tetratricopeptide (TPR) repeat protein
LPLATSQIPFFNALGTPEKDKSHRLIDVGHCVPLKDAIDNAKQWFDRYLGTTTPRGIEGGPDEQIAEAFRAEDFGTLLLSWEDYATAESYFKKALDLRCKIQGDAHRETLRTMRRLAAAVAGQGRNDEALDLLGSALKIQQKELEPNNPEVREAITAQCELWRKSILEICGKNNRPRKDYERAAEFARRLTKAGPVEGPRWLAAYAFYRQGDQKAGAEAIQESLVGGKEELPEQWLLAAMLFHRMGDEEQSRDWFAAASRRINATDSLPPALKSLRQEAASMLSLPEQWPPVDWSAKNYLEVFDRLIAKYHKVAWLREWRGSLQGSLSQWDAALVDYQKAIELDPMRWSCRESFAAITLWTMEKEDPSTLCRGLIDKFKDHESASLRMDMVVICSLAARADVDRELLDQLAEGAISSDKKNPLLRLGKGMAAFRCGRYEEALEALPEANIGNPKVELLSSIFRAMARHQLGDIYTARKLLETARQEIQKQIPTPAGPTLACNSRPAAWCMIQMALREAEVLMPPESR